MPDDALLERLLTEWLECEPHETAEGFIARHAEHADLLRQHFAMQELVEQAFDPNPPKPDRVGPFRIEDELGTGGMGTVYRAVTDQDGVAGPAGTTVALKLMHPHLFRSQGFFKRFLREAALGQQIDHPNVVRTLDVDAVEQDGSLQHFLVMEYVEGQTLRQMLDGLDRAPEELARHLGIEIGRALAAIHEAGAVHRDLKPENVLVTPDQCVKVMDLGVAQLVDEQVRLSRTGAFVGSLQYAAPEQFRSGAGLDARADLHGLGLLLYELCTGENPYHHEDAHVAMQRILSEDPRRLGERNPQVSPFLEEVVHQLLKKDPEERFLSANDLLAVLEAGEGSSWWQKREEDLRQSTARPLRRIRIPRETALYGRDDELEALRSLYAKAKAGEGQVLLLEGEAGIGKTRLVDEFVGGLLRQGEDLNFLFGSYPPSGAATATGAFSTAYREHLGSSGLENALQDLLRPSPVLVPAFAALLRGEPPPTGAEPLTQDSLQTAFVHATRGLATERPTIILIDDLHFAPEDGQALFSALALAVAESATLLVGTSRPGLSQSWSAELARLDHALHLVLPRLGPKDLGRLLRDAFHSDRLAEELGFRIAEKSDGNPFFAFEIIRGLKEGQFLTQRPDGSWHTTELIEDIEVPSSVLDLVSARVANLSEREREVLDVAACWGYEFDPILVGNVIGLDTITVLRTLGQIERAHRLVRASGRQYVFDHHQVQEALYGTMHERLRETYHAGLAIALEERVLHASQEPSAVIGDDAVDLCHHFLRGARPDRALSYLDEAQAHLERCDMPAPAVALVGQVLASPGLLTGRRRAEVLVRLSRPDGALERRGDVDRRVEIASELSALLPELTDEALRTEAVITIGDALQGANRFDEAATIVRRSADRARRRGLRKVEARLLKFLGDLYRNRNRLADAQEVLERAVELAGDVSTQTGEIVTPWPNLGIVLALQGKIEEARHCFESHLALARARENRREEAWTMGSLGLLHWQQGRLEEARSCLSHELEYAQRTGRRRGEMRALGNLAGVLAAGGEVLQAESLCERLLLLAKSTGSVSDTALAHVNLGPICRARGATQQAKEHLERALQLSRDAGLAWIEAYALQGLADVADERAEFPEACSLAREALEIRRRIGQELEVPNSLAQYGELLRRTGDHEHAVAILEEAVASAEEQDDATSRVLALAGLAALGQREPSVVRAALEATEAPEENAQAHFILWQATGDVENLARAKNQVDATADRVPLEYRESMLKNVRLNREIMEAWAEHGEKAVGEGDPE